MESFGELAARIADGYEVTEGEALRLAESMPLEELCALADRLRRAHSGDYIDTCSIMNARSGRCSEDCKWCSQSRFHKTEVDVYPLVGVDETLAMATYNAKKGVRRFSLVTSGRAMTDSEIERSCEIYREIKRRTDLGLCASMGLLSAGQLERLAESGVERYHCNLETAPSYFPELCTTHTTGDKVRTLKAARQAGMQVCSGGIIGMGETMAQRVEMAAALRDLGVDSIPLNVLSPIKGTRLEAQPPLSDEEVLRTFAIFRVVNPRAHIRFAGGRLRIKHLERRLLHSGVSASILGDMLTTAGSDIDSDRRMFGEEGFSF